MKINIKSAKYGVKDLLIVKWLSITTSSLVSDIAYKNNVGGDKFWRIK